MEAYIDIENADTKTVEQITVPLLEYVRGGIVRFDISNLSEYEFNIIKDAINSEKEHIDIEMFFTDITNHPIFGPDYEFKIVDNVLEGNYIRDIILKKGRK